jgi:hypothetical protein
MNGVNLDLIRWFRAVFSILRRHADNSCFELHYLFYDFNLILFSLHFRCFYSLFHCHHYHFLPPSFLFSFPFLHFPTHSGHQACSGGGYLWSRLGESVRVPGTQSNQGAVRSEMGPQCRPRCRRITDEDRREMDGNWGSRWWRSLTYYWFRYSGLRAEGWGEFNV